jgi:hypothetical protein
MRGLARGCQEIAAAPRGAFSVDLEAQREGDAKGASQFVEKPRQRVQTNARYRVQTDSRD